MSQNVKYVIFFELFIFFGPHTLLLQTIVKTAIQTISWSEPELNFHGFTPWIPRRPVYEPKYELSLYPLESRAHLCTFFLVPPTSFLHNLILPSAFASSILNAILSSPLPSSHSSSSSFLQLTCENIYHPPHLRISPKGRLSSFPYLLPLSRSSLSFHSVFLILSLVCQLSQNTLRHTLPCHLSTLSARMEGKFPTYLPTAHFFYVKSHHSRVPQPPVSAPASRTDLLTHPRKVKITWRGKMSTLHVYLFLMKEKLDLLNINFQKCFSIILWSNLRL